MTTVYKVPPVENKADIIKQIEIERENLVYFNYMSKEEAYRQAKTYVENKYSDVVENLKGKGLY
jgi:hypothetical protein